MHDIGERFRRLKNSAVKKYPLHPDHSGLAAINNRTVGLFLGKPVEMYVKDTDYIYQF